MAEWSIAAVLKTAVPQGTGGSNPSLSATQQMTANGPKMRVTPEIVRETGSGRISKCSLYLCGLFGEVPEWSNGPDSKSGVPF